MFELRPLPAETSLKNVHILIATWFGAGRSKIAPGTMGSLAAIPVGYLISYLTGFIGLAVAAMLLLWIGTLAADYYGRKSGQKDDQAIVVDEVVGMWIAAIPAEGNIELWLAAFVLFRLFDIWKPWPASFFDKRGTRKMDVMLDDVVAGVYAMLGVASLALIVAMQ
jgi:phosphatidylglycerophosphatase A